MTESEINSDAFTMASCSIFWRERRISMADATAASATVGWLPVFTLLLAAGITLVATVITSLLQHRLTSQRQRETRRELRRDQLAERRAECQRRTRVHL